MLGVFSSLFKQRKPKQFGFKPVYYNAEKEAHEKRIAFLKNEVEWENDSEKIEFRKLLREKWKRNQSIDRKKSKMRVLAIAGILTLICYFLLK